MASLIGQTIGNYRVTRLLGEGGMGVVYQAEHPVIGRKVAIKLLHTWMARDQEVVARFFNEARAIHTVGHENIVEILDFGQTAEGQAYFIMEFLAGEALNERVARGPLPPKEVAAIADQICRALGAAHGKGIIHRDLKPQNIHLVTAESGRVVAKLLDFGVAKITNAGDLSHSVKTQTGSLMGTPLYMSPEQCRGAGEIDHRTDVYSLGVVLYEMLAGRPPFVSEGVVELFAAHMLKAPPPLTDFAPGTPPAMAAAVMRALSKEAPARFSTMEDLRKALLGDGSLVGAGVAPAGGTQAYPARGGSTLVEPMKAATTFSSMTSEKDLVPAKSRSGLVVGALLVAAAGAATYFLVSRRAPSHQPEEAASARDNGAESAPAAAPGAAAGSPPAPSPSPSRPAAATPTPKATVTIRFESEPPGVHVFRATDDKDLGTTPLELTLPRHGGKPSYVFRRAGYQEQALTAELDADRTLRATLEKNPAEKKAAPPAATPARPSADKERDQDRERDEASRPAAAPKKTRKPGKSGSMDQDGLAIPTF